MLRLNPYLFLTLLCLALLSFSLPVKADEDRLIYVTYYKLDKTTPGKYRKLVEWQINNPGEWAAFSTKVKSSQLSETQITNPMDGSSDVIHFSQRGIDGLTGEDFYITQNGISYVSSMAIDSYSRLPKGFRPFLDRELKNHSNYKSQKRVNINTPGLVIVYNASKDLDNPMWVVQTKEEITPYLDYIKGHKPLDGDAVEIQITNGGYDLLNTYTLYLNIPFAPARFATIQNDEYVRMTSITPLQKTFVDQFLYFSHYRKVAQDVLISEQSEEIQKMIRPNENNNF